MLAQITSENQSSSVHSYHFGNFDVRTFADEKSNPWFCGTDVCQILGYKNSSDAITKHCRKDGVAKRDIIDDLGRKQEATFIDEGNLYRLTIKSRKPEADPFEAWVCDEVLPSIRKTGGYVSTNEPATITRAQAGEITQLILERAGDDKTAIPYFRARFNNQFRLASYKDLPATQFEEAVAYIPTIPDKLQKQLALPAPISKPKYREGDVEQASKIANGLYELVDGDVFAMPGHSKDMFKQALGKLRGCLS